MVDENHPAVETNESHVQQVLVTGASSGIGLEICRMLLDSGIAVVGISSKLNAVMKTAAENSLFSFEAVDFEDIDAVPQRFEHIAKIHPSVDACVMCAGKGQFGGIEEFSYKQIKQLMDINFTAHAFLARTFVPLFKTKGRGDFIFIGSEAALTAGRKGAVYCAGKFALRGMAKALREECSAKGIRVGMINPGMVKTGFYDELRFSPGEHPDNSIPPHDVAALVLLMLTGNRSIVFDEINLTPLKKVIKFKK